MTSSPRDSPRSSSSPSCPRPREAAERQQFTATAHDLKTGKVVYVENYDVEVDGSGRWRAGTTRYASPDGKTIAERKFDFSRDRYVQVYSLDQTDVDYKEGITRVDPQQVDVYVARGGKRDAATLARARARWWVTAARSPISSTHLAALERGETIRFTLVVPGRSDSFRLRARKVDDRTVDGRRALHVRIELDSMLRLIPPDARADDRSGVEAPRRVLGHREPQGPRDARRPTARASCSRIASPSSA